MEQQDKTVTYKIGANWSLKNFFVESFFIGTMIITVLGLGFAIVFAFDANNFSGMMSDAVTPVPSYLNFVVSQRALCEGYKSLDENKNGEVAPALPALSRSECRDLNSKDDQTFMKEYYASFVQDIKDAERVSDKDSERSLIQVTIVAGVLAGLAFYFRKKMLNK